MVRLTKKLTKKNYILVELEVHVVLLGVLLIDLCDARIPLLLSRGSGGLTGPGRIPAFHWEVFIDSLCSGCVSKLCIAHCGLFFFCLPAVFRSKDKNICKSTQIYNDKLQLSKNVFSPQVTHCHNFPLCSTFPCYSMYSLFNM